MNTQHPLDDQRLETLLRELPLHTPEDDALSARLEQNLCVAYRRRRMRRTATRLAWAACLTAAAVCLALPHFSDSPPELCEVETECTLVQASFTGRTQEGASYEAVYERRILLQASNGCRIAVSVPEKRSLIVPDETI